MKNKLTRKLMLSAFTLLFAVISLGASTYAWFTLSKEAQVEHFEANVTIGSGLNLQAVSHAENSQPIDGKWEVSSLTIPSTLYSSVTFMDITPVKASDLKQGFSQIENQSVENGYICFDLFFKLTNDKDENSYELYFKDYEFKTKYGENVPQTWTIDKAYIGKDGEDSGKYEVGEAISYKVQDAARLGILPYADNSSQVIYQAPEPTENPGEYTSDLGKDGVNAAYNYYKAVNPKSTIQLPAIEDFYEAETAVDEEGQFIGELTGDDIVKITVYVWIEGWDAECINAIFAQTLSLKLNFELKAAA